MRSPKLSKLLSLALLSAGLLGGCNSDYTLFRIHAKFNAGETPNDRQNIEYCVLTIRDGHGAKVEVIRIDRVKDPAKGNYVGCGHVGADQDAIDPQTPVDIGVMSYSSSLASGTLSFQIEGKNNTDATMHTGTASAAAKVFHSPSDEVPVEIQIDKCPDGKPCP
jgi:hypothetical protein